MRITWQEIRKWGSCYPNKKLQAIFGERGLTPKEIRCLNGIPLIHLTYVLVHVLIHCGRAPITDYTGWCALRAYYYSNTSNKAAFAVAAVYAIAHDAYADADEYPNMDAAAARAAFKYACPDASPDEEIERQLDYLVELIGE